MAKFAKWLGAGLGWSLGGPIGAAIGLAVGSVIDGFTLEDLNEEQQQYQRRGRQTTNTQSGDFEISLLVLASVVIKADGKIDKRELDYVRTQFVNMYGKERANNAFRLFRGIMQKEVSVRQVSLQIRQHMSHSARLQLVHFLFGIAKSDGFVSSPEEQVIQKIASYLYINPQDYISIRAMFYENTTINNYAILEIDKTATDAEVKKAYRKMAKKYHPDKLQSLGKEHLKGAQEKFQRIQAAYEEIKKERGIS